MTPQQLRNSILQLAIEGKLVGQRPEEGTGEALYQLIEEQKKDLIKAGKIKRQKALPEITEAEIPFEIPHTWKWVRLKQIVYQRGQKKPTSKFWYIDIGSIDNINQKLKPLKNIIDADSAPSRARRIVGIGDILYSTVRPYLHNMCIIDSVAQFEIIASTGLAAMTCYEKIFNKYLFYYLLSPSFDRYANSLENSKGVAYPAINDERLYKAVVPLPPFDEQKRIVEKIEAIFPIIDIYGNAWQKLDKLNRDFSEKLQKSILQEAIQGKLSSPQLEDGEGKDIYIEILNEKNRLIKEGIIKKEKELNKITAVEIPFDIPKNWIWARFGDLGSYRKGPFGSALTKNLFVPKSDDTVKVYEQKNAIKKDATLGEYYITKEYYEEKMLAFTVMPGDIIVSCAGTIGETFILPENSERGIINQALMRMRLFKPIYTKYFLLYFDFILKQNVRKNSKGSAIKNIPPFSILKNYLVPLPPIAEQKRIVEKVHQFLLLLEQYKSGIE